MRENRKYGNVAGGKLHQQHNEVKKDTHVPMTVDEVCEYLGISKSSFLLQSQAWWYSIIKQGKHLFVYRDELDKWLESGRKGETPISIEEELARMLAATRHKANPKDW